MDHAEVGETVSLEHQFFDEDGVAFDPAVVTIAVVLPDGTTDSKATPDPVIVKEGIGDYSRDYVTVQAGIHQIVYTGPGARNTAETELLAVGLTPSGGPCESWCTWDEVILQNASGISIDTINASLKTQCMATASEVLYGLTEGRYPGLCQQKVAICSCSGGCGWGSMAFPFYGWSPLAWGGSCGCDCAGGAIVDLGTSWPVWGVLSVIVAGAPLARSAWRVDDWRWLRRTDGQLWPTPSDLSDPTQFQATIIYGQPVPAAGRRAAATLAMLDALQYAVASCSDEDLDESVTQIVREGVTYTKDPKATLDAGRTGVMRVDHWLEAERLGFPVQPGIFDPYAHRQHEATGTDRGGDR